jgi:hypothetical protein
VRAATGPRSHGGRWAGGTTSLRALDWPPRHVGQAAADPPMRCHEPATTRDDGPPEVTTAAVQKTVEWRRCRIVSAGDTRPTTRRAAMGGGRGRTPEELETLLEDALRLRDTDAVARLFEDGSLQLASEDSQQVRGYHEILQVALPLCQNERGKLFHYCHPRPLPTVKNRPTVGYGGSEVSGPGLSGAPTEAQSHGATAGAIHSSDVVQCWLHVSCFSRAISEACDVEPKPWSTL